MEVVVVVVGGGGSRIQYYYAMLDFYVKNSVFVCSFSLVLVI